MYQKCRSGSLPFGRILMALVFLCSLTGSSPAESPACYPVPGYEHHTTIHGDKGLVAWVGVDRAAYALGDSIRFCLVLKNDGMDTLHWGAGYAPIHGFDVVPDTCFAIDQPGCSEAVVWHSPEIITWFGESIELLPGECEVRHAGWDGLILVEWEWPDFVWGLPKAGEYHVLGGIWRFVDADPFPGREYYVPPGGVRLRITLGPEVPVRRTSWGRVKTRYR